ncbi:MAG TPA: alpha/beta hydrolase [Vineibacter sp.]|nr:alpha/beta hydrolase [Vineibacter sp.]
MKRRVGAWLFGGSVPVVALAAGLLYAPDIPVDSLLPRYASARSQFLEIGGARIHVRDEGRRDGSILMLLHGSSGSLHVWEGWTQRLGDTFRIVSLDLPGHGLTGPWPRDDYSIGAYADLTMQVADRLKLEQFAVGGHSMGGAVAWTIATRRPERITHLVLVGAAAYPRDDAAPIALRVARTPLLGELNAYFKPRWMVERGLRETYADPARLSAARIDRHYELLRRAGNRAATLRRLRTAAPLDPSPLASLNLPTLILWGTRDRWVPPIDAARLQRDIAGSELVFYQDTGHALMEETPDRSAAAVRRFLMQ